MLKKLKTKKNNHKITKFTEILGITKDNLKTEVIQKSTMLKIYGTLDESNGNKFHWENSDVYFTRSKK